MSMIQLGCTASVWGTLHASRCNCTGWSCSSNCTVEHCVQLGRCSCSCCSRQRHFKCLQMQGVCKVASGVLPMINCKGCRQGLPLQGIVQLRAFLGCASGVGSHSSGGCACAMCRCVAHQPTSTGTSPDDWQCLPEAPSCRGTAPGSCSPSTSVHCAACNLQRCSLSNSAHFSGPTSLKPSGGRQRPA